MSGPDCEATFEEASHMAPSTPGHSRLEKAELLFRRWPEYSKDKETLGVRLHIAGEEVRVTLRGTKLVEPLVLELLQAGNFGLRVKK